MNDLISRAEAVRFLRFFSFFMKEEIEIDEEEKELFYPIFDSIINSCASVIKDTVPEAKERTGFWTYWCDDSAASLLRENWRCSCCETSSSYGATKYCPSCGAKMTEAKMTMVKNIDGDLIEGVEIV